MQYRCLLTFGLLALAACLLVPGARAERLLKVAVYDNRPLVFAGPSGKPQGIYIDLLEYVGEREGYHFEYVMGSWPDCLKRLDDKDVDMVVAIAHTKWRDRKYAFTNEAVLSNWGRVYARPGPRVQSFLDLNGRMVAVPRDDIYFTKLVQLMNEFGITCRYVPFDSYQEVIRAVAARQVDAGVTSRFAMPPKEIRGLVEGSALQFAPITLKLAFVKTMDASVIAAFDRHLVELKNDPTSPYWRSLDTWLGRNEQQAARRGMWMLGALGAAVLVLGFVIVFVAARTQRQEGERRRTERRKAGGRRAEDRDRLAEHVAVASMTAAVGDTVMAVDPESHEVLTASGYVFEMFGYLPLSARGLEFERFVDEDVPELEPKFDEWLAAARTGGPVFVRWAARHTGERRFVAESCCRLAEVEGRELLVVVTRDASLRDESGAEGGAATA